MSSHHRFLKSPGGIQRQSRPVGILISIEQNVRAIIFVVTNSLVLDFLQLILGVVKILGDGNGWEKGQCGTNSLSGTAIRL